MGKRGPGAGRLRQAAKAYDEAVIVANPWDKAGMPEDERVDLIDHAQFTNSDVEAACYVSATQLHKGFYNMVKRACIAAGLPHCSAHGLRKAAARRLRDAGCPDDEGMAITGHKSVAMYLKYAGDSGNAARADSAMARTYGGKVSNPPEKLDTATTQPIEKD